MVEISNGGRERVSAGCGREREIVIDMLVKGIGIMRKSLSGVEYHGSFGAACLGFHRMCAEFLAHSHPGRHPVYFCGCDDDDGAYVCASPSPSTLVAPGLQL